MFDWSHYLDLAGNLAGEISDTPEEEAKARTSISRSYYCVYHTARQYLREEGDINIDKKIPDPHRYVIEQLKGRVETKMSRIGNQLERLKNDRVMADYHENMKIPLKEAIKSWKMALWLKAQIEKETRFLRAKKGRHKFDV